MSLEEPSQISKDNFLEVPSLSDSLSEDEEVKATFRPGFSPQPRRGSDSSEDIYSDSPPSGARRVSFADTFDSILYLLLNLDSWNYRVVQLILTMKMPTQRICLSSQFGLPSQKKILCNNFWAQKAVLESTEYPPDLQV